MSHNNLTDDGYLGYSRIQLKRLEDVLPDEDYILHASKWWRVLGERYPEMAYDLEIAGYSGHTSPETDVVGGGAPDFVVVSAVSAGLQFRDGAIYEVPWPCCELIYVKDARRRRAGADPDERVFGIFSRHYDSDGDPYYAPIDQEMQPGVSSGWFLDPRVDLILDWEPVDVAGLLERMRKGHD